VILLYEFIAIIRGLVAPRRIPRLARDLKVEIGQIQGVGPPSGCSVFYENILFFWHFYLLFF